MSPVTNKKNSSSTGGRCYALPLVVGLLLLLLMMRATVVESQGTEVTKTVIPPPDSRMVAIDGTSMTSMAGTTDMKILFLIPGAETVVDVELSSSTAVVEFTLLEPAINLQGDPDLWPWCKGELDTSIGTARGASSQITISPLSVASLATAASYKLCTIEGFETNIVLHILPSGLTSAGNSGVPLPLPATAGQFGEWATVLALSPMTDSMITKAEAYFVDAAQESCAIDGRLRTAAAPSTDAGGIALSSDDIYTLRETGYTSVELCLGGSRGLKLVFHFLDEFKIQNQAIDEVGPNPTMPNWKTSIHAQIPASLTLTATRHSIGIATIGSYYPCQLGTYADVSSSLATASFLMTDSSSSVASIAESFSVTLLSDNLPVGLCMRFTGTKVNVSLGIQLDPYYVTSLDGVSPSAVTSMSITYVPVILPTTSTVAWEVQSSFMPELTLFLSSVRSCGYETRISGSDVLSVVENSTNLVPPLSWYSTAGENKYLCVAVYESGSTAGVDTPILSYRFSAFTLQVVSLTGVYRTGTTAGGSDTSVPVYLLSGVDTEVHLGGTVYSSVKYHVGAVTTTTVDSATVSQCTSTAEANRSNNGALFPVSALSLLEGQLCVIAETHLAQQQKQRSVAVPFTLLNTFQVVKLTFLGYNNVSVALLPTPVFPIRFSISEPTVLSTIQFRLISAAVGCSAVTDTNSETVSFDAQYQWLTLAASSGGVGEYLLCWVFSSSPTDVGFSNATSYGPQTIVLLPAINTTGSQFPAIHGMAHTFDFHWSSGWNYGAQGWSTAVVSSALPQYRLFVRQEYYGLPAESGNRSFSSPPTGRCRTSTTGYLPSETLDIPLYANGSITLGVTTQDFTAGIVDLCAALIPVGATQDESEVVLQHPIWLGEVLYAQLSIADTAVPPPSSTGTTVTVALQTDNTTQEISCVFAPLPDFDWGPLELALTASFCSNVTPAVDFTTQLDLPLLGSAEATTNDYSTTFVLNTSLFESGHQYKWCARLRGMPEYQSVSLRMAGTKVTSLSGEPLSFTAINSTNSTTATKQVSLATINADASRTIDISGLNLHVPQAIHFELFVDEYIDCAEPLAVGVQADLQLNLSVTSSATGTATFPSHSSSVSYLTVCLHIVDVPTQTEYTIHIPFVFQVIPIVAFERRREDGTQQHSVLGVKNLARQASLLLQTPSPDSIAFEIFATTAASCAEATATEKWWLPFDSTTLKYVTIDARNRSSGMYLLCVEYPTSTAVEPRLQGARGRLGTQLVIPEIEVLGYAVNSNVTIGTTVKETLSLRVTGAFLSSALLYFAATDGECAGTLSGTTLYGNSRVLVKATGCGSNLASATLSAATTETGSDKMNLCMAVSGSLDDTPTTSDLSPFFTGIYIAVTKPTELIILRGISSQTNQEQSFDIQPMLGLRDADTGAVLGTLPTTLVVRAEWISVSPISQRLGEIYELSVARGDSTLDFAESSIPIQLRSAVHGVKYVLEFSATGGQVALPSINSTTVTRSPCYSTHEHPVLYTSQCMTCPSNAHCDGTLAGMRVKGMYWRPTNLSTELYSCSAPFAEDTCLSNTSTGDCVGGHTGPRCSVCRNNYAKTFGKCTTCPSFGASLAIIIVIALVVVFIVGILVLTTLRCRKSDQFPIYIKLLINHCTVAATVGGFSYNLPTQLSTMFGITKQFSRPSPEFASFQCITGFSWYDTFTFINIFPPAIGLLVGLILAIAQRREDKQLLKKIATRRRLIEERSRCFEMQSVDGKEDKEEVNTSDGSKDRSVSYRHATVKFVMPDEEAAGEGGEKEKQQQTSKDGEHQEKQDDDVSKPLDFADDVGFGDVTQSLSLSAKEDKPDKFLRPESATGGRRRSSADTADLKQSSFAYDDEEENPEFERKESDLGLFQMSSLASKQRRSHIFVVIMVVILFFTYPTLVEACANVLRCDTIDFSLRDPATGETISDVRSYFFYDRQFLCSSARHKRYIIAAIVLGIVWGLGIPLCCTLLYKRLRRPRKKGGMGMVSASRMFTFLVAGYRPQFWWWEAPMLLRKLAVIYIVAFISDGQLQNLVAFWIFAIHLWFHMLMKPYEYQTVDDMEKASLVVLCVTLNVSMLYQWTPVDSTNRTLYVVSWILTIFLMLINLLVILWMLWCILREGIIKARKEIREEKKTIEESTKIPNCLKSCILRMAWVPEAVVTVDDEGNEIELQGTLLPDEVVAEVMRAEESASDWSSDYSDESDYSDDDFEVDSDEGDVELEPNPLGSVNEDDEKQESEFNDELVLDRSRAVIASPTSDEGKVSTEEKKKAANGRVMALRAIVAGLRSHSDDLMSRYSEASEKLEYNERVIDVYKKQLFSVQERVTELEGNLETRLKDMQTMQANLARLEEENVRLRGSPSTPRGGAEELSVVERQLLQERNEYRRRLAEQQMAIGQGFESAKEVLQQVQDVQAEIIERKSTIVELKKLQKQAQEQHAALAQQLSSEHTAQEEAIAEQIRRKKEERMNRSLRSAQQRTALPSALGVEATPPRAAVLPPGAAPPTPTPQATPLPRNNTSRSFGGAVAVGQRFLLMRRRHEKTRTAVDWVDEETGQHRRDRRPSMAPGQERTGGPSPTPDQQGGRRPAAGKASLQTVALIQKMKANLQRRHTVTRDTTTTAGGTTPSATAVPTLQLSPKKKASK